jgi:redox-sensitive bicupin YhaK (pirin superfamily)
MSAGTGVKHSEFNPNAEQRTKLLQIWVYPNQQNVDPRYQQITLNPEDRKNRLTNTFSKSRRRWCLDPSRCMVPFGQI